MIVRFALQTVPLAPICALVRDIIAARARNIVLC